MVSKRKFTERFGDPANFSFRDQRYRSATEAKCALCGRDIRNVYTLLNPQGRSVRSGECCFLVFEKWNPVMYTRLLAAQILLDAVDEAIEKDIKTYNAIGDVTNRLHEWRKLKRQALSIIRGYKLATESDWLPKSLFDLQAEAEKIPGKTLRWFDSHTPILKELLKNPSL